MGGGCRNILTHSFEKWQAVASGALWPVYTAAASDFFPKDHIGGVLKRIFEKSGSELDNTKQI